MKYLHEMYERVLKPYNLFTIGETPHNLMSSKVNYMLIQCVRTRYDLSIVTYAC